ncbi:MAG: GNAT family N-acetyltransferase [Propionibacteriaceae bacterium]
MTSLRFDTLTVLNDDALRGDILAMWKANTEQGAAVGANPGDPDERYAEMLAGHEESMAQGRGWLHLMREQNTGELLGFAWWIRGEAHGAMHIATIKRLQIAPQHQGEGLGKALMDFLHTPEVLAGMGEGLDFLHLQFRAGNGLGDWYGSYGYELNVRWDVIRKLDDGHWGGWGEMIRRVDGTPMPQFQA